MKRIGITSIVFMVAVCSCSWSVAATDLSLVEARQKFFGAENVDALTGNVKKDKVIFSYMTNTTFAVSVLGRVILLDTFVTRLEITPGRTPFVIQDVIDLRPEAILIGHGHRDHADNAAYIAMMTNATIYATPETCDAMQADSAKLFGAGTTVPCVEAVSRGSTPGDELVWLRFLEPVACVLVFKHLHSASVPYDPTYPRVIGSFDRDPRDPTMFPLGTSQNSVRDLRTTGTAGPGGTISLVYDVIVRAGYNFHFVWHDTTGPLKEGIAPERNWGPAVGQKIVEIMDSLAPVDVQLGAALLNNIANNGLRDLIMYQQHLKPKVFYPGHLTDGVGESYSLENLVLYRQQQAAMGIAPDEGPEARWLVDPTDYLRPIVYSVGDPRWFNPAKAALLQRSCR